MADKDRNIDRDKDQTDRNTDPYRDNDMDTNIVDPDRTRSTQPGQEMPGDDENDEDMDEDSDMDEDEGEQI